MSLIFDSINYVTSFLLLDACLSSHSQLLNWNFTEFFGGTHELIYAENNLLSPYTYLTPVHVLGKVLL